MKAAKPFQPSTAPPAKILDHFFRAYQPKEVKASLWKIYRLAVIGKSHATSHLTEEDIALLFDQLIHLVEATSAIHQPRRATLLDPERSDRHD